MEPLDTRRPVVAERHQSSSKDLVALPPRTANQARLFNRHWLLYPLKIDAQILRLLQSVPWQICNFDPCICFSCLHGRLGTLLTR